MRVAADSMSQEQHAVSVKEEKLPDADWYVLALKQTDLNPQSIAAIVRLIGMTPGRPPLLCLQNGTGHIERLKAAAEERFAVVGGVTSIGAKREDLRSVRYTGRGTLYLEDSKDDIRQKMLLESLIRAGFDASLSNDILNHVYQKLLVNAIINPLTAIFDQPNGELPEHSGR
ncbi:ketopantoate reductase family protein, partial [Mycobacterium tuberculosis]